MRNIVFSIVLGAICLVPGLAMAAPSGAVLQPDPQLTQTWWTSMAVRDGVRERDEVSVNRNGQKIAEGLVVSVQGDHSSIMLKGANVPTLQKGDIVVLVHQAPAIAQPVATTAKSAPTLGYKVVGGHSMVSVTPGGFNGDIPVSSSMSVGSLGLSEPISVSPLGFDSQLGVGGSLGLGGGLGLGSGLGSGGGLGLGSGLGIGAGLGVP